LAQEFPPIFPAATPIKLFFSGWHKICSSGVCSFPDFRNSEFTKLKQSVLVLPLPNNAMINNNSSEIVSHKQLPSESANRLSYSPEVCIHCQPQTDLSWKDYLEHNLETLEFNRNSPEPELLSDQVGSFDFFQSMIPLGNPIPPNEAGGASLTTELDIEIKSSETETEFLENYFPHREPEREFLENQSLNGDSQVDIDNSPLAIILSPKVPNNSPVVDDAIDTPQTLIDESNRFDIRKLAQSGQAELTAGETEGFETAIEDPQNEFEKIPRIVTRENSGVIQQDNKEANIEASIDLFQKTDQIKIPEIFPNDRPPVFTNLDSDAGTYNLFKSDGTLSLNESKGVYSNPKLDVSHFKTSSVVDQVIEVFSPNFLRIAANGTREINIKIYPEELGTLSISVFQVQRELKANIVANEWLTTEILFRDKTFLMDLLKEKGLELADINISHRDSKGDSSSKHQNNHDPLNHRFDSRIHLPSTLTANLLGSHLSRSLGGIDLIV